MSFRFLGGLGSSLLTLSLVACTGNTAPPADPAATLKAQVRGGGVGLELDRFQSLQVTTPGFTNRYARHMGSLGYTEVVSAASADTLKRDATFKVVRGLADANCYSFESLNFPGQYLRHAGSRVRLDANNNTELFRLDATWCSRAGLSGTGVSFESKNFPNQYLRHASAELWLSGDNGGNFRQDASWNIANAWAGASGCNALTWGRGTNYALGTVVLYPGNGQYYKLVNVGQSGSDGTDPTVSTWYWQPTTCTGTTPPPPPPPSSGFVVSEAQYNQMFPNRVPYYSYSGFIAAVSAWPAFATTGSETTKRQEAAAFLANMHHESGGGQYIRELNQANWNSYCSSGNCGGKQYYGRGPIQLSWDYNYRAAGAALGLDLLNNPDLVATDASVGWKTALWYWMTQRAQAARTPHDSMVQGAGFGETIRAINGGLECNGAGAAQRESRINLYRTFSAILGVDPGPNLGC